MWVTACPLPLSSAHFSILPPTTSRACLPYACPSWCLQPLRPSPMLVPPQQLPCPCCLPCFFTCFPHMSHPYALPSKVSKGWSCYHGKHGCEAWPGWGWSYHVLHTPDRSRAAAAEGRLWGARQERQAPGGQRLQGEDGGRGQVASVASTLAPTWAQGQELKRQHPPAPLPPPTLRTNSR